MAPLATAALVAAAPLLAAGPAHAAGPVCSYGVPFGASAPGLTATVCIERSGQSARGVVWVQNAGTAYVYVKADAHTDDGGANGATEGWVAPGAALYDAGSWLVDWDSAGERGHATLDHWSGTGWQWTVVSSPVG
ncbi:hypothetical protein [Streptomyces sp. NPDC059918]|uniref:hypothetical protein n=1 Tax=unclassified Streptomyces TaxID=2593676 RepID=UPI003647ED2E